MKKYIKNLLLFDYYNKTELFWKYRSKAKKNRLNNCISKIYLIKMNKILVKFNASIPLESNISKFIAPHGLSGIFISKGATIGENCTIFQQVTIGSITSKGSKNCGAPWIGNNVYIGAGAKIIGKIKIGSHVRIGANCIVVNDIEDYSTVVMEKARVIINKTNDNEFINFDSIE